MSFNPNQIKLGKKKTTSKKTPEWLFPDKIDSQSKSSQEAKEMSKKKLAKQVADNLLKRRAAGETSKTKPCSRLLDAVDAFLIEIGYSNSSKAFKAERKSHGENGINIKNTLSLIDIFNEWQKIHTSKEHQDTEIKVAVDRERDVKSKKAGNNHAQASGRNACSNTSSPKKCQGSDVHMADATEDGSSSSSSSDSSSSSSTSSDSDADDEKDVVPIKTPDPSKPRDNGKKRKASFSNDSDSSSNQSKSKSKKMKIGAKISDSPAKSSSNSSNSSSSNDSSSSDSDSTSDENPTTAKAGKNDSSSSDSSSSDSESTSDENPTTAKAGKNDSSSSNSSSSDSNSSSSDGDSSSSDSDSSSSDSDSSSSDSDSSSSDGDSETSTQSSNKSSTHQISKSDSKSSGTSKSKIDDKEMTAIATSKNPSNTAKTGNAPESSTKFLLPATAGGKSTKTLNSKRSIDDPASFGKKPNEPFSRIPKDIKINEKLASNAYVPYDYAQKAHEDLIVTKGKNFTKEKNKKKRGSYRGGHIDVEDKKGIKFED